ncbi:MAG: hypothetical protein NC412_14705, partial [Roseburia sp.]|nr:hypothetical protein [Roseburia sp.]MCM1280004.1 hypothetical protein [Robinsoniella sp.]
QSESVSGRLSYALPSPTSVSPSLLEKAKLFPHFGNIWKFLDEKANILLYDGKKRNRIWKKIMERFYPIKVISFT